MNSRTEVIATACRHAGYDNPALYMARSRNEWVDDNNKYWSVILIPDDDLSPLAMVEMDRHGSVWSLEEWT